MKTFVSYIDPKRNAAPVISSADVVDCYVLTAGVAKSVTVPTGAKVAVFSALADFWYNPNGTASVPVGDVTNGTSSILNPTARGVEYLTTLSFISEASNKITIEWFS